MIELSKRETITITRQESCFDRACDSAYRAAINIFGIDDFGHSTSLKNWDRSNSWIELKFVSYTRINSEHIYTFTAIALKNDTL